MESPGAARLYWVGTFLDLGTSKANDSPTSIISKYRGFPKARPDAEEGRDACLCKHIGTDTEQTAVRS